MALDPKLSAEGEAAFGQPRRPLYKRVGGWLVAAGLVVAKLAAELKGVLLLLPKLKLLTTSGTMLVSVAAYSLIWGPTFAVGFVLLLFVHEMGHVIALRREGIAASAPVFIPFLGAVVWAKMLEGDALAEARVGLAGPVLGTLGAGVCVGLYAITGNDFFRALAFTGFFLNLFNLAPIVPLDGGRAMAALSPWMWLVGFAVLVAAAILFPNPIMILILVIGALESWRRFKALRNDTDGARDYYRVAPRHRLMVAAVYVALIVGLAAGMHLTHLQRTFADA